MPVTLKSRLPEISAAIPAEVGAALHEGTDEIAKAAQDRASALYQAHEEAEPFSIHAGEANVAGMGGQSAYGILASWFWFFGEFGTTHQSAKPFMLPAAEAGKDGLEAKIRAALEKL